MGFEPTPLIIRTSALPMCVMHNADRTIRGFCSAKLVSCFAQAICAQSAHAQRDPATRASDAAGRVVVERGFSLLSQFIQWIKEIHKAAIAAQGI